MEYILTLLALFLGTHPPVFAGEASKNTVRDKSNIVINFTDNQGYGDLGCFGSATIRTPHLDRLATEGRKFTSFMVPANICSPSRRGCETGLGSLIAKSHK